MAQLKSSKYDACAREGHAGLTSQQAQPIDPSTKWGQGERNHLKSLHRQPHQQLQFSVCIYVQKRTKLRAPLCVPNWLTGDTRGEKKLLVCVQFKMAKFISFCCHFDRSSGVRFSANIDSQRVQGTIQDAFAVVRCKKNDTTEGKRPQLFSLLLVEGNTK